MAMDLERLVNADSGLVSRRIFIEPEIYEQELQRIFARCWLFLCHDSMIPNPGDFLSTYMGEDSILVTRDNDGKVHALLNVCRHRGNRVCRADMGNASSFTCTYHGWTYRNDGKLIGVPNFKEAYYGELDRDRWGLVPVTQLDNYKGFYFGTFDSEAPSLMDYLGEMRWYMDAFFDRREGGIEVVGGVHKSVLPCNWKFPAESFGGDGYHVRWTHISAMSTTFTTGVGLKLKQGGTMISLGNGHCIQALGGNDVPEPPIPELLEYEAQIRPEVERRLGARARLVTPFVGTIFPNFSILRANSRTFRVWQPRGPDKIMIWSWNYMDKAAPSHVKEALRLSGIRTFGPGGTYEQDDMDN